MTRKGWLAGIDAGASRSAIAVADEDGSVLASLDGPATYLSSTECMADGTTLRRLLVAAAEAAGVALGRLSHLAIGINGVDVPSEWAQQHASLCRGLGIGPERVSLTNDAVVALWGATHAHRGAIVQLGSAFTAAYRSGIGSEHVFDPFDLGRIFDLRRETLPAVARMLDGRAPRTGLVDRVLAHLDVPPGADLAVAVNRDPATRARARTLTPVVVDAWLDGDEGARSLVEAMALDLARTVTAMAGAAGRGSFVVALGGGVLSRMPDAFFDLVSDRVGVMRRGVDVILPAMTPELGAVVLAGHRVGLGLHGFFSRLEASQAHVVAQEVAR